MNTNDLNTRIELARQRHKTAMAKRMTEMREKSHRVAREKEEILSHMRPATAQDYTNWVRAHIERGGSKLRYFDYPTPLHRLYVAEADFRLARLCGADSISVIVPEGIEFLGGEMGHCRVYLMDGRHLSHGRYDPDEEVCVYSDTAFDDREIKHE